MDVKLVIYSDEKRYFSGKIPLPCVIGRGKQCDVAILQPLISRRHCEIYEEREKVMVRDLGSLNGTFFGGAQIGRGAHIPFGSSFSIGKLFFKIEQWDGDDDSTESCLDNAKERAPQAKSSSSLEMRKQMLSALQEFEKDGDAPSGSAGPVDLNEESEDDLDDVFKKDVDESSDVIDLEELLKE